MRERGDVLLTRAQAAVDGAQAAVDRAGRQLDRSESVTASMDELGAGMTELAGQVEGTVSSLGLLYTTFAKGEDSILVPNSVVLNVAVLPLREPEAVNLRARLRPGMTPSDLQELLDLTTPWSLMAAATLRLKSCLRDQRSNDEQHELRRYSL